MSELEPCRCPFLWLDVSMVLSASSICTSGMLPGPGRAWVLSESPASYPPTHRHPLPGCSPCVGMS